MKQTTLTILVAIFFGCFSHQAKGCDFCGCGVGSYYFGAMPMFHKNAAGIRYRTMAFASHLGSPFESKEYFGSAETFFRLYPHRRWQIMGFVPYSHNLQQVADQNKRLSGLGDALAVLSFNLYNNLYDSSLFKHNLFLGAGIKLPTGQHSFDKLSSQSVANPNFQLGTGSTDFLFNLFHSLRKGKWGLNTVLTYKLNLANADQYRFGNRVSADVSVMRIEKLGKKMGLAPYFGIYAENSMRDERNGYFANGTGGHLFLGNLGLDCFLADRVVLGGQYQMPVNQNLAEGNVKAFNRWMLQLSWLF